MAFSIMTFSITTLSIKEKDDITIIIHNTRHNCHSAYCTIMLSVIMLSDVFHLTLCWVSISWMSFWWVSWCRFKNDQINKKLQQWTTKYDNEALKLLLLAWFYGMIKWSICPLLCILWLLNAKIHVISTKDSSFSFKWWLKCAALVIIMVMIICLQYRPHHIR